MAFRDAIVYLDSMGLTDIVLPFVLIFSVLYAILQKIAIFQDKDKKPDKKINSVLALAITLLTIIPHVAGIYPGDMDPVAIINTFLPGAVLITIIVLMALLLIGMVGGQHEASKGKMTALVGTIALIMLVAVIWRALYPYSSPNWLSFLDDPNLQAVVIILIIMGIVVWYVTADDSKPKKSTLETLQEMFK